MDYKKLTTEDIENLRGMISDPDRFITEVTQHWDHDQFKTVRAMPDLVIQPVTAEEVASVLKYASDHNIPLTPRGNSTGLMGANLTVRGGISLDMVKMNKVVEYDPNSLTITVQPGIRLNQLEEFLADKPFTYMPAPAMHWATVAGNISTNAGGLKAIKYGVTREHIREVKVALTDGKVYKFGSKSVKSSSGYSLKDLIIGSEGTLGVITEAVLRLYPRPKHALNAIIPFPTLTDAIESVPAILASGVVPTTVEYMGRKVLNLWEKGYDATFPIKEGDGFIILGIDSFTEEDAKAQLAEALKAVQPFNAMKEVVLDAESEEAKVIWDAREKLLLAIQKSTPKMDEVDVSVPINKIPLVLKRIEELEVEENMRIPNFGHAGDGNLHIYLCSDDLSDEEFAKKGDKVISELYKTAKSVDGNMSGEHGVGYARQNYYEDFYGKDYTDLLRKVKGLFDPKGILNPDKIFPLD
ncbi:Glycolate oxidase [Lactobacillus equicursoris DSM 19284 = JCM 14600 = CIP 110162]|uniref:Glycolate oxidase, subunit GlcD n=2 Tax=Lactobacillus equicursoris TaxID=420645 RepID=K0NYY9_9LACO|nr:FAD-binding oxidoreductase [Lactobacillus equicursoris]KRK99999.1 glycolate oxidase, subunit GlcD [Lactobacillus equicursoris DSM 19284 = JCM 14600 = CIP 110162]MST79508.1 FAD-binding oxidoreductase [Lactobacillus equicursoris]CCK85210.1 Glycolate oxidase [Lactobacillus equicursoris DSM 19284 = JCM 14600 = CIP 110162]